MKNILKGLKLPAQIPESTSPTPPVAPPSLPVDHAALLQHLLSNKQAATTPPEAPAVPHNPMEPLTPQHKFARLMGALRGHNG